MKSPLEDVYWVSKKLQEDTRGWVEVLDVFVGDYEWSEIRVFWSPAGRMYLWHYAAGCSCTSWGEELGDLADFNYGDRNAVRRALEDFAEDNYVLTLAEELRTLANFKETT